MPNFAGASNWFTSSYPTSAAAPGGWGAYAEDPSGVKAATFLAAWLSFQGGASASVFPSQAVTAGTGAGLFVGAWGFQYGWVWQATATWCVARACARLLTFARACTRLPGC